MSLTTMTMMMSSMSMMVDDLTLVTAGMRVLLFIWQLVEDTYPPLNSSYRRVQT
jgi:hypothetical protein